MGASTLEGTVQDPEWPIPSGQDWGIIRDSIQEFAKEAFTEATLSPVIPAGQLRDVFRELLIFVEKRCRPTTGMTSRELGVAVALLILGSEGVGDPPSWAWQGLGRVVVGISQGDALQWLDTVIGYGCGWHRDISSGADAWGHEWSNAVLELNSMVTRAVRATIEQLARRSDLIDFNMLMSQSSLHASLVTLELVHRDCQCGNHQKSCRQAKTDDDPNRCKRKCCLQDHVLDTWDPINRWLPAFIAQVVRGSATDELQTGAFVKSALYSRVLEDVGLRVGLVEFKICHICYDKYLRQTLPKKPTIEGVKQFSKQHGFAKLGLFEGARCPVCREPANRKYTYYITRKNWLLIPYTEKGPYELVQRLSCRSCGNLYPCPEELKKVKRHTKTLSKMKKISRLKKRPLAHRKLRQKLVELEQWRQELEKQNPCPRCEAPPSQRTTTVWVYNPQQATPSNSSALA
jgi:hypothetical protein